MKVWTGSQRSLFKANLLYAIVVWGMLVLGLITGVLAFFGFNPIANAYDSTFAAYMVIAEALPILVPGLILLLLPMGRGLIPSMRLKFHPSALLALPAGAAGYLFVIGITAIWMALLTALGLGQEAGMPAPSTGGQFGLAILIVALWPALCEEFLFRGILLPAYEKHLRRPIKAILLTGVAFALVHGQVTSAPGHIFLGIVMGALVVMTGSIWTGVIYHFTNNAMAMALSFASTALMEALGAHGADTALFGSEAASPSMLALGGVMYMAIGGVIFAGMVALMWLANRRRLKENPVLPKKGTPEDPAALQEEAERSMQTKGQRFMPYLPMVLAAPIVLLNYITGLVTMMLSGAGLL